jgi:hypothetical protein
MTKRGSVRSPLPFSKVRPHVERDLAVSLVQALCATNSILVHIAHHSWFWIEQVPLDCRLCSEEVARLDCSATHVAYKCCIDAQLPQCQGGSFSTQIKSCGRLPVSQSRQLDKAHNTSTHINGGTVLPMLSVVTGQRHMETAHISVPGQSVHPALKV